MKENEEKIKEIADGIRIRKKSKSRLSRMSMKSKSQLGKRNSKSINNSGAGSRYSLFLCLFLDQAQIRDVNFVQVIVTQVLELLYLMLI